MNEIAQWCNSLTFRSERSGGVGSIPGRGPTIWASWQRVTNSIRSALFLRSQCLVIIVQLHLHLTFQETTSYPNFSWPFSAISKFTSVWPLRASILGQIRQDTSPNSKNCRDISNARGIFVNEQLCMPRQLVARSCDYICSSGNSP